MSKMTEEELTEFKKAEEEESNRRNRRSIEFNKRFDFFFVVSIFELVNNLLISP